MSVWTGIWPLWPTRLSGFHMLGCVGHPSSVLATFGFLLVLSVDFSKVFIHSIE